MFPEKKPPSPKKPTESLSDRLRQVEDSLQKLQVMGDLESVRAASVLLKSPARSRIYHAAGAGNAEIPAREASKENYPESSENKPTPLARTSPTEAYAEPQTTQPTKSHDTAAAASSLPNQHSAAPGFVGTGRDLLKPQLADHLVLQATIQRATQNSMKTLLKNRETLPRCSERRDQLASYQQDSTKIATSLKEVNPNPAAEAAAQVDLLGVSITQYHHTVSALYPLSPLGDQSIRGDAFSPVPLSELSLLRDKMQSWRTKYAAKPPAPSS